MPSAPTQPDGKPRRISSIDAYRGFVMLLMLAECLPLARGAERFPESGVWQSLKFHTSHVEWRGCSLHDLIQPSFSFLVGVALPFSLASRAAQGFTRSLFHAAWRSFALIALGIFLRSDGRKLTNFTFEDTLSQIGLGYFFLFLLGYARPVWHWVAFGAILMVYWGAFVAYPAPSAEFDYGAVGVPATWPHHATGLAAHWNLNSNLAWDFDTWFLNLFPRDSEFRFNGGGYATLSFIPTLATMILGLIAGTWMKSGGTSRLVLLRMGIAGVLALGAGYGLDALGICPNIKKLWTPAWVLYSGGICFLMLGAFVVLFDVLPLRMLALPLLVIGANSIFIYAFSHLAEGWIVRSFETHMAMFERKWDFRFYEIAGPDYQSLIRGSLILGLYWIILTWMYRQKLFVKI